MLRRLIALTALAGIAPAIAQADVYSDLILSDNPVAYYRFDDASDSSGNGFDGTLSGTGGSFADAGYVTPGGISLGDSFTHTTSSFIDLGLAQPGSLLDALSGASAVTVEYWLDSATITDGGNVLFLPTAGNAAFVGVGTNNTTGINFGGRSQSSDGFQNQSATVPSGLNHIVGIYDYAGGLIDIYVNGALEVSNAKAFGSSTFNPSFNANPGSPSGGNTNPRSISIGRGANGNAGAQAGNTIDELAIYDRALTPAEILERSTITAIPEPGAFGVLAAIGAGVVTRRRRR